MDLLVWDQLWKDGRCTTSVSTESGMDPKWRRQQMELLFNGLKIIQSRWYAVYGTSRFKLKENGVKPYDLLTTVYKKFNTCYIFLKKAFYDLCVKWDVCKPQSESRGEEAEHLLLHCYLLFV